MKKLLLSFAFLVFLVFACCPRQHQPVEVSRTHTVRSFENEYEGGLLRRTVVFLSYGDEAEPDFEPLADGRLEIRIPEEEHLYTYRDGELVKKEVYLFTGTSPEGDKRLSRTVTYGPDSLEETGTGPYEDYLLRIYDEDKRVIRRLSRKTLPDFETGSWVNSELEELFAYNEDGRLVQNVTIDKTGGNRYEERIFYDSVPRDATFPPGADIVCFSDSSSGDTLIGRRMVNGRLDMFWKKLAGEDYELTLTHDPDGRLVLREEIFFDGTDSLYVNYMPEMAAGDSVFYRNGLEIKSVVEFPDHKITELSRYDTNENLSRQERIEIFYQ